MFSRIFSTLIFIFVWWQSFAQLPPVFDELENLAVRSTDLTTKYLTPIRIVWTSDDSGISVQNTGSILKPGNGQADLNQGEYLTLISDKESEPGIIIDILNIHSPADIIDDVIKMINFILEGRRILF